ncbi:MAG: 5'-nucleotidase C-terminal domain-containing protein [Flavobacteriaceae bacterium]|nr:5'-nucleotidase C-terminal domain-containing protein [Flavobacteriaceae bacterium]
MNYKHFIYAIAILIFYGCRKDYQLTKIEGKRLEIDENIVANAEIEAFIKPYRMHVNKNLDRVLSYAVDTYSKKDGEFNTAIGNMMADAVMRQSNPIFKKRTGNDLDIVLLNYGGIRSILSQGNVSIRTAYQIMPFENSVVVATLKGTDIKAIVSYLQNAKEAHPIAGMQLQLDKNFNVISATIKGQPIEDHKTYYVATNDYLYHGGDHMTFFKNSSNVELLDYKIRNVLIDYFTQMDTLKPTIDKRFTKHN